MSKDITSEEIIQYISSLTTYRYITFLHKDSIFPIIDPTSNNEVTLYSMGSPGQIRVNSNTLTTLGMTHHGYFNGEAEIRQLVNLIYEREYTTLDLVTIWEILSKRGIKTEEIYPEILRIYNYRMGNTLSSMESIFKTLYVIALRSELATINGVGNL